MLKQFLRNYILGGLIINNGAPGPEGPRGLQGPKGDTGPMGPAGVCDVSEINAIKSELAELNRVVDSLKLSIEPLNDEQSPTKSYFADVMFLTPIEASDGTPLIAKTLHGSANYVLEFSTDSDNLKILNTLESLSSTPKYINLEVQGAGRLIITIRQILEHRGATHVFSKEFCSLIVTPHQRDYYVNEINSHTVTEMMRQAEHMGRNILDSDS
jgi:hypothetical protein